jgi:toxin ParE1/3/4
MSLPYVLTEDAEADLAQACAWYEGQRAGLGTRFDDAVRATLELLAQAPEAHPPIWGDVRRVRVQGFKYYVIHYVIESGCIGVISVFHTRRDPNIWRSRI